MLAIMMRKESKLHHHLFPSSLTFQSTTKCLLTICYFQLMDDKSLLLTEIVVNPACADLSLLHQLGMENIGF